ncbi:MAG: hypothetical protein DLM70_08485 [Chloroflexi bacterium]|nr:MAG: hypothetical protein DLM70_08485 [Chloroflexota bacterium]
MSHLVDSDWVADYLKGRAPAVTLLDSLFPKGLAISIITYAEVYEGIYSGTERRRHDEGVREFLRAVPVLSLTRRIARRYVGAGFSERANSWISPTCSSRRRPCSTNSSWLHGTASTSSVSLDTSYGDRVQSPAMRSRSAPTWSIFSTLR